ncbi:MAG: Ig-like domain-containing protein [Saprospiraceae bacterium]|nr:Ig-like domain-containing protein [Saprospiraceae bacterium]
MPQQNQRYQNIFQQCVLSVHAVKYFVVLFFLCFFEGSVFPHKGSVAPGPTPPFIVTRTYTVAGSYSFTVPKGVTSMTIEAWGGGGRGGSKTTGADGAAGGGGGAYSREDISVVSGESFNLEVGAGSSSNSAHGGDSWVSTGTFAEAFLLAKGGKTVPSNGNTGGEGGLASEGIGAIRYSGGRGSNTVNFTTSGGGGSSGGYTSHGSDGNLNIGGTAPLGGGNGGNGRTSPGSGAAGQLPGGGGGGAVRSTSGSPSGGNGGRGQIIITYTFAVEAGDDQTQCHNAFFQVSTTIPPTGFTTQWSVISGNAFIFSPAEKSTSVHVPAGSSATLRMTVSDGITMGTDDVILVNTTSCIPVCQSAFNINGDLESEGTANLFPLSFNGTQANLIDQNSTPLGWSEYYQNNTPSTSSFTGAYYLNGTAHSGTKSIYLAGNGFGVAGWESSENLICGKTYRISFRAAAYTNAAIQANTPFVMAFEATGNLLNPYQVVHNIIAPASQSWALLNWQRYSFEVTIPASMYTDGKVVLIAQSNTNGIVLDDLCFEEVSSGADASAGEDIFNCENQFDLSANIPDAQHEGTWTVTSGSASIDNPDSPQTTAQITSGDVAKLSWTVNNTNQQNTITLIDPEKEGGFELGNSFGANGWTVINQFYNRWAVGSNTAPTSGEACAYISLFGGNAGYYNWVDQTVHFYRDVIIHPEAEDIMLSFKWKGVGESGHDRLLVYTAPVGFSPSGGSPSSPSTNMSGATLVSNINLHSSNNFQTAMISLPDQLKGTSIRLIFTWQNDDSGGAQPPAVIDEISLTHKVPFCSDSDEVVISYNPSSFSITNDTICVGDTATLVASGCNNGNITWSNGSTGAQASFFPVTTTTYTATCTPLTPSNILLNPGFESTTNLQFWSTTGPGASITTQSTNVHEGSRAAVINGSSGFTSISQPVDVLPGDRYILKVRAKTTNTNKNPKITYQLYTPGWAQLVFPETVKKVTSHQYEEYVMEFIIPPDAGHLLISAETEGGILYTDQWSLHRYTECVAVDAGVVVVQPLPVLPIVNSVTQPTCYVPSGTIVLTGLPENGNWVITQYPGELLYAGSGNTYTIQGLLPNSTYHFYITNDNGCTSANFVEVTILPIPSDPVLSGNTSACVGSQTNVFPAADGLWSSGNVSIVTITNDGLISGISPGNVLLTYTRSSDGCDQTMSFDVFSNPAIPFIGPVIHPTCSQPTGSVTLQNLPDSANWTITRFPDGFTYSGTGTTYTATGLSPNGNYTFVVQDFRGCSSALSANVFINPIPANPVLSGDNFVCHGTTAQVMPNQNGTWSSGDNQIATVSNTGLVTGLNPGNVLLTYTRTTDGCSSSMSFSVYQNPQPPMVTSVVHPTCIIPTGTAQLTGLPLLSPWELEVLPGGQTLTGSATEFSVSGLTPATDFTFLVTDSNGCVSSLSLPVSILPIPADPVLSGDSVACVGTTAQVLPSSGGTWSSANNSIANVNNGGIINTSGAGTVVLTYIRNSDGCQSTKSFEVYSNPLTPVIGVITQPTCIIPTGSVELSGLPPIGTWTVTSSPLGYTYVGTGTEYTVSLLDTSTTFTFTVTDQNQCISSVSANVVIQAIPTDPVLSGDSLICVGSDAAFFPSNNGNWVSLNPSVASITTNGVATAITSGMATFNFTRDGDGCSQQINVPVYDIPSFPIVETISQPTCIIPTGSVVLGGLPGFGTWKINVLPGNVQINGSGIQYNIQNLVPDSIYHFSITDFRGCTSDISSEAVILDIPENPIITGDSFVCINATTQMLPSSDGIWVSNNPSVVTIDNTGLVEGLTASDVVLTFTRTADGCSSDLLFTVRPLPVAPGVGTITQPTCLVPTGSVELIGLPSDGDWIISRNPGDTLYMNSGISTMVTGLPPGNTYTFSVVNQYNCLSVPSANAAILSIPEDPVLAGNAEICEGLQTQVFPNSGGNWASANPLIATITDEGIVQATGEGTVQLSFSRNSDGCASVLTFTVHPSPATQLIAPEVCQDSTLIIYNTPQTGLPAYIYEWSGPNGFSATTQHVMREGSFLSMSGLYYVTITDARGCIGIDSISGVVNPKPLFSVTITDVSTFNGNNGAINLTTTGGTPPYLYLWSNTATTEDISGLPNGLYSVTVTDSKSCRIINQPEFSVGHPSDCSGFRTQTQGGWGTGASGNNPGAYRDANFAAAFPNGLEIGCNNKIRLTSSAAVEDYLPCGGSASLLPPGLMVNPSCINNVFTGQLIALTLSATFDLYDPNFGSSDENLINLRIASGPLYRLTVGQLLDEANNLIGGCGSSFTISQLVTALTFVNENYVDGKVTGNYVRCCNLNVSTTGGTICSGNALSISVLGTNGIAPFTYTWSDGLGTGATKIVTPSATTTYTVTVTDDLGCTKTATVTVNVNPSPVVTINAPAVCSGTTLVVTPFINNGTPAFTYNWRGPGTFTSTASVVSRSNSTTTMSGLYTVTVTDSRGCSATASGTATVNPLPTTPLIGTVTQPLCVPSTGSVILNGLPSTGTWTITRSPSGATYTGSGTSFTVTGLPHSTSYRFRVINQNNCSSSLSAIAAIGNIPPDPPIGGITETCIGNTTYVDPGSDGVWTSSNPSVASVNNAGVVTALNPGTTTLSYTKTTDGCDNSMLYTVYAKPIAPVIENVIQPTCYLPTGSIELSGLPDIGFWTILRYPNAIPYQGSGTNMVINGLPIESSYTFTVINGDYCTSNVSANAIINGMPVNPVLSGPPSICTGATTNFLPNSGGTWTSSNPLVATINNSGQVTALAPGTATFTFVRLSDGCRNSITLIVFPNPDTPLLGGVTHPTCISPTGQIELNGLPPSGNWTLTILPENTQITGTGSVYTVAGLAPGGTYSFLVNNDFLCASPVSAQGIINPVPADPVLSGDDEICFGESTQVYPDQSGTWTSSNLTIATINNAGSVFGVGLGLVSLTYIRNSDGCRASKPFQVRSVPNVPFIGTTTKPTCLQPFGSVLLSNLPPSGNWKLTIHPDGDTIIGSGLSYLWTGLMPDGIYQFSVSSQFQCSSGVSANAIIESVPSDPVLSGQTEVCAGSLTTVLPSSNGVWLSSDPGIALVDSAGVVTGISGGDVVLTYTRTSDGCDSSMILTVHENPLPPLVATVTQPTCLVPTGSVLLQGLPEFGPWSLVRIPGNLVYQGSGPDVLIQNLPASATYTFRVFDANNCSSEQSIDVVVSDIPEDPVLSGDDEVCMGSSASVFPSSGGTWSSGNAAIATINASGIIQGIAPGITVLTYVRNSDGCDAQKIFTVNTNPPAPFLGIVIQPTCIEPTGSVLLSNLPRQGTWVLTIQPGGNLISGSGTSYLVTGLLPDTHYTFTINSDTDCSSEVSGNLYIQPVPSNPVITGGSLVCLYTELPLSPATGGSWVSSNPSVASVTNQGLVTGLAVGMVNMTYTRSSDGCTTTVPVEVKDLPQIPSLVQVVQPTCYEPTGSVVLGNMPSTGNWTLVRMPGNVQITGTGSSVSVYNLPIDQWYNFNVVDINGCGAVHSLPVFIDSIPQSPVLSGDNTICFGETSQLSPTSGGIWESSEPQFINIDNNGLVTSLMAGSAVLTYTRLSDGCSNTMNFFVDPNPVANIVGQPVFCSGSFGVLEATGGVIYVWNTGATSPTLFVNNSGFYAVTVTNSFGCKDSTQISTTISGGLIAEIHYQGSVCIEPQKQISALAFGGLPPYSYQWSGPEGMTWNTDTISVSENGNYFLTITDAAGCTAVTQGFIYQAYEPLIVSLNTQICEGRSVQLQVNSPTAIAYQWDNNANFVNTAGVTVFPSFPSTLYQVTVTDDLGCTAVPQIEISVLEKPETELSGPSYICVGDTTRFLSEGSGQWFSINPNIATINNNGVVTGISGGEARFIFISNSNNCASDTSVWITVHDLPVATLFGPSTICETNYSQALPDSGGTWVSLNPSVASINNVGQILGLSSGTASFIFTSNTTGCSSEVTEDLTVTGSMILTVSGQEQTCIGSNVILTPNVQGGYWTSSDTSIAKINNSGIVHALHSGTITLSYFFQNGECLFQANHPLIIHSKPDIQFVGETTLCEGESTFLTPSSGGFWMSSNPAVATISLQGNVITHQAGTATFSYVLYLTGCQSEPSQMLTVHALPITELTGEASICEESVTTVGPTTNGVWSSNNPSVAQVNAQGLVTGISQGMAYLTFTNALTGCSNINPIEIQVHHKPEVSIDFYGSVCLRDNAQLGAIVQGGTPSFSYVWTGPGGFSGNTKDIFITLNGEYFVSVTDNKGCSAQASGLVYQRFEPLITGFQSTICEGDSTSLSVVANAAASFQWGTNANNSVSPQITVFPDVPSETFSVTVTNNEGCSVVTSAHILVNPKPVTTWLGAQTICAGSLSYIQPISGGTWTSTNPLVASISQNGTISAISSGTSRFIYTSNITGCSSDSSSLFTVHEPTPINYTGPDQLCKHQTLQLTPAGNGVWSSSNPGLVSVDELGVVTGLQSGVSLLTFTNDVGCTSMGSVSITVFDEPAINLNGNDQICIGTTTNFLPSVGGQWTSLNPDIATIMDNGTITGVAEGSARFLFTLTETGCISDTSSWIIVNDSIEINILGADQICIGQTTQLTPNSGGLWVSNQSHIAGISPSGIVTGLQEGTATFSFTSFALQCFIGNSLPVTVRNLPSASLTGPSVLCLGDSSQVESSIQGVWYSSDPDIASVDQNGLVVALSPGSVSFSIMDTITGCMSFPTQSVTVYAYPIAYVAGQTTICEGGTTNLFPSSGGSWVSTNPSVAMVNNNGLVMSLQEGTARFIFIEDGSGCVSLPTDSIIIEENVSTGYTESDVICEGKTTQLYPSTGGSWVSLNPEIATVNSHGLVTGLTGGFARFVFTSDNGCISDPTSWLTVHDKPQTFFTGSISICQQSQSQILPLSGGLWQSSRPTIASINDSGIITGLQAGNTKFVFTDLITGCRSDSTDIFTVYEVPSVTLTGPSTICVGQNTSLTPTSGGEWISLTPSIAGVNINGQVNGLTAGVANFRFTQFSTGCSVDFFNQVTVNPRPVTAVSGESIICMGSVTQVIPSSGGTWTSLDPMIASVNSSGVVTGINQGIARLRFTDASTGCTATPNINISVIAAPFISLNGPAGICVGDQTTMIPSGGGTWFSSNPSVATITNEGTITAVQAGNVQFYYTNQSTGCQSVLSPVVTIHPEAVLSLTGSSSICIGYSTQLQSNVSGVWHSTDALKAVINPSGKVTGLAPGKAGFYFIETETGCMTPYTGDTILISNCVNPDFNVTNVSVLVQGNVHTNDLLPSGSHYGVQPVLVSKPDGSVDQIQIFSDGRYSFKANIPGQYRYMIQVCLPSMVTNCPQFALTVSVVDPNKMNHCLVPNLDLATTYKNTPVVLPVLDNDRCINSTTCMLDPDLVEVFNPPLHGTASFRPDHLMEYTPENGFIGTDTIIYRICADNDPLNCRIARWVVVIKDTDAGKSLSASDDFFFINKNSNLSDAGLLSNDISPENRTFFAVPSGNALVPVVIPQGSYYITASGLLSFIPDADFTGPLDIVYQICDTEGVCVKATAHVLVLENLRIKARGYLESALLENNNARGPDNRPLMRDNLRVQPFDGLNYIPSNDPYSYPMIYFDITSNFRHVGAGAMTNLRNIPQPEVVFAVSDHNAIVDWVFLELRNIQDSTEVLATRSCLIQRDGDVVDLDGISDVEFPGIRLDSCYIVLRHRNHFGVMSKKVSTRPLMDFTSVSTPVFDYGTSLQDGYDYTGLAQKRDVVQGYMALWAGDFDGNGKLKFVNPDDDQNMLFSEVLFTPLNVNFVANFNFSYGYFQGDYNMNGKIKYDNPDDDKNYLFYQILFHPLNTNYISNFNGIIHQLPPSR